MAVDEVVAVRSAQGALSWSDPAVTGALDPGAFSLPIGTVTFLLTDIEDSTRHWQRSPESMGAAVARVYALLDDAISAHGGVRPVEQGEGDSVVAAFSRASDALLAARAAQVALHAESWPTVEPVRVRMAVHTGDATLRDEGNYMGQTIIRTARLRAIAHGGQVVLSAVTRDLTIDQLGSEIELVSLGTHRLKDLARPEDVWQLAEAELPSEFPPLRSLDSVPNNLPVQLSTFVGRLDEIATVATLVRGNRLVTITGTGGAGKTRLSQQVAAEVSDQFPDGAWWVELVATSAGLEVPLTIAAAIGGRIPSGVTPGSALATTIADRRMLLVLDNCEHVIADIARLVDELLRACPNLGVLATSRIGLDVPGELTWRIPALSLPPAETRFPIGVLGQFDAVRLFVERAKRVRPNFVLDDANGPAVAEICQRLDGIPLALELAAARCRSLSPAQIREGLNDSLRLLTGGARTVLPRQQTLEASIDWSYSLLTDVDKALLRRLAVFVGGFDLTAAEAVASDREPEPGALTPLDVLDGLDRLVEQSLVMIDDDHPGPDSRYRLLETVRQYARSRLVEHDELDAYLDAHCDYFRSWPLNWSSHARVMADPDNALAALSRAAQVCSTQEYVDFLVPVIGGLLPTQRETQLDALIEECLLHLGTGPSIEHAKVLAVRGRLRLFSGRIDEMREDAHAVLAIAEPLNANSLAGAALNLLGSSYLMSDPGRAIELLERAVTHSLAAEDWIMAITSYGDLGLGHAARRELTQATSAYDAHAELERDNPALYMLANEQAGRAQVAWLGADFEEASRLLASTRDTLEQLGAADDPWLGPFVTFLETSIALARGEQLDEAATAELRERFDRALTRQQFIGAYFLANCLMLAAMERVDTAEARQFGDLLIAFGSEGPTIAVVDGRLVSAALHHDEGDLAAAMADVEYGRAACEAIGDDISAALFDIRAGLIALARRDIGTAESLIHAALRTVVDRGFRREVVIALEAVALADAASGNWTDVARLHVAASRLRDELGYRLRTSPERESYADVIGSLSAEHADAITEGTSMDWPAAAEYALRTWGARKRPAFGWQSLTPTELQVVGLAATGLTNPQIADRLIMGRATVKTHLSNAYTKLDVKNRTELATRAATELPNRESPTH
jgi:predicted ATPase/class 3 adenylate cyclase/DNA-binding CsgD family transcriptional regulator